MNLNMKGERQTIRNKFSYWLRFTGLHSRTRKQMSLLGSFFISTAGKVDIQCLKDLSIAAVKLIFTV